MKGCYVDSSALIKWYVLESGSRRMLAERGRWNAWFTSRLTYAECLAAFGRLRREGVLGRQEAGAAMDRFREEFAALTVVDVTSEVLGDAHELVEREAFRGGDLVHAATASWLHGEGLIGAFFCADRKLGNAVAGLGLAVIDPMAPERR